MTRWHTCHTQNKTTKQHRKHLSIFFPSLCEWWMDVAPCTTFATSAMNSYDWQRTALPLCFPCFRNETWLWCRGQKNCRRNCRQGKQEKKNLYCLWATADCFFFSFLYRLLSHLLFLFYMYFVSFFLWFLSFMLLYLGFHFFLFLVFFIFFCPSFFHFVFIPIFFFFFFFSFSLSFLLLQLHIPSFSFYLFIFFYPSFFFFLSTLFHLLSFLYHTLFHLLRFLSLPSFFPFSIRLWGRPRDWGGKGRLRYNGPLYLRQ